MKRKFLHIALLAGMAMICPKANADVIVLVDGTSKQCYNVEPAKKWIYFTETDSEDAPVQRIAIEDVFAYKIGDGKMQMIGNESAQEKTDAEPVAATTGPTLVQTKPSDQNPFIIERYNTSTITSRLQPKDKIYGGKVATIWGITEESIMDDENINVSFENSMTDNVQGYRIRLENKTNKPLYVDLANSFRVGKAGNAQPFFTNSVYTTSQSATTGVGVNIGVLPGVGVGVGSSSSAGGSVTQAEQSILVIPPKSAVLMPGDKQMKKDGVHEYPIVFYFIHRGTSGGGMMTVDFQRIYINELLDANKATYDDPKFSAEELGVKENSLLEISEGDSPKTEKFIITYSPDQDFGNYYQLPIGIYLRAIFGKNQGANAKGELRYTVEDPNAPILIGIGDIHKKYKQTNGRVARTGMGAAMMGR